MLQLETSGCAAVAVSPMKAMPPSEPAFALRGSDAATAFLLNSLL